MMKRILLLCTFACFLFITGCSNPIVDQEGIDQSSSDAKAEKDGIEFSQITSMQYESLGSKRYGVFFEFKNTTDENILVDSMVVTFYDSDGTTLETGELNFAPGFLKPGDIGYGGGLRFDVDEVFPSEGVTAEINVNYDYDPDGKTYFICEDPKIVELSSSTTIGITGIEVTVKNQDKKLILTPVVVAGLFDDAEKLIGYGLCTLPDAIEAGGEGNEFCDEILVYPNMDINSVSSINAKARVTQPDAIIEE